MRNLPATQAQSMTGALPCLIAKWLFFFSNQSTDLLSKCIKESFSSYTSCTKVNIFDLFALSDSSIAETSFKFNFLNPKTLCFSRKMI